MRVWGKLPVCAGMMWEMQSLSSGLFSFLNQWDESKQTASDMELKYRRRQCRFYISINDRQGQAWKSKVLDVLIWCHVSEVSGYHLRIKRCDCMYQTYWPSITPACKLARPTKYTDPVPVNSFNVQVVCGAAKLQCPKVLLKCRQIQSLSLLLTLLDVPNSNFLKRRLLSGC